MLRFQFQNNPGQWLLLRLILRLCHTLKPDYSMLFHNLELSRTAHKQRPKENAPVLYNCIGAFIFSIVFPAGRDVRSNRDQKMRWYDFLPWPRLLDRDDACHTHSIVKRTIVIVCPCRGELETYGRAVSVERLVKLSVLRRWPHIPLVTVWARVLALIHRTTSFTGMGRAFSGLKVCRCRRDSGCRCYC